MFFMKHTLCVRSYKPQFLSKISARVGSELIIMRGQWRFEADVCHPWNHAVVWTPAQTPYVFLLKGPKLLYVVCPTFDRCPSGFTVSNESRAGVAICLEKLPTRYRGGASVGDKSEVESVSVLGAIKHFFVNHSYVIPLLVPETQLNMRACSL